MYKDPEKEKDYHREWARQYREKNRERVRQLGRESHERHREKRQALSRDWKARHPEQVKQKRAEYFQANKDREYANHQAWLAAHPELAKEYQKQDQRRNGATRRAQPAAKALKNRRQRERYQTDIAYCIEKRLRASLTQALRRASVKKTESTFALIGCSIQQLVVHLEAQFGPGMTWENRAEWHVDHIQPVARFDLTDPESQRACFHWTNLQPLWGRENQSKGSR